MKKRKFALDFWSIVTIGILVTFGLFLIYPLVSLFIDGFLSEETGQFTLNHFIRFFTKKYYYCILISLIIC